MRCFASARVPLPGRGFLTSSAIVMLLSLGVAILIAHFTRFGTNVYAIGGDRESARLMGVPIRRTTVMIYALAGFYRQLDPSNTFNPGIGQTSKAKGWGGCDCSGH